MRKFAAWVAGAAVDFVVTSCGVAIGNYLYDAVCLWVRNRDLVFGKSKEEGEETTDNE